MTFTFYLYWKPADMSVFDYPAEKGNLEAYFGKDSLVGCLNRVDMKTASCESRLLDSFVNNCDLSDFESWANAENFLGCLINDINP